MKKSNNKQNILKELDELSKKCEIEKKKEQDSFKFLSFFAKSFTAKVYYCIPLTYFIFYLKYNLSNEINFIQFKYFYNALIIGLFCLFVNFIICIIQCIFNKDLPMKYKKLCQKILIKIIILVIILLIGKLITI